MPRPKAAASERISSIYLHVLYHRVLTRRPVAGSVADAESRSGSILAHRYEKIYYIIQWKESMSVSPCEWLVSSILGTS
jgi:hypothetical protein